MRFRLKRAGGGGRDFSSDPSSAAKNDGFLKNPSAALRGNFVVAAHRKLRLTPQLLGALHCRGEWRSPNQGRPAGRPYNRNHRSGDVLRDPQE